MIEDPLTIDRLVPSRLYSTLKSRGQVLDHLCMEEKVNHVNHFVVKPIIQYFDHEPLSRLTVFGDDSNNRSAHCTHAENVDHQTNHIIELLIFHVIHSSAV